MFAPRFDDEEAVGNACVFRLIPLQLEIAHEPTFVRPVPGSGSPAAVELIGPDERITGNGTAAKASLMAACSGRPAPAAKPSPNRPGSKHKPGLNPRR